MKLRPAPGGLPWPLLLRLAVPATLLVLLTGFAVIAYSISVNRAEMREQVRVQASILAASTTAALDFEDIPAMEEYLRAMGANPAVEAAGVYAKDGRRLAEFHHPGAIGAPAILPRALPTLSKSITVVQPVRRGGEAIGAVYLRNRLEAPVRGILRFGLVALLATMAMLVAGVLWTGRRALKRANQALQDRARALADANSALQLQMGEREKAEEALRQAQKMQALGQLTGGIAHDFNNLLTVIQGSAALLGRPDLAEEKRNRHLDAITQSAGRAATLTGQLLAFARRQPLSARTIDLNTQISAMMNMIERTLGPTIHVVLSLDPAACPVKVDPTQLEVAILNAAVNARDAMPDGGTLTVTTAPAETADGVGEVVLSIADSGIGIPPELMERVFEPFFTTKSVGKGTGLGLSQIYGFASQSGGRATIESGPEGGAVLRLYLPCATGPLDDATPDDHAIPTASAAADILLVEDNADVATFAKGLLTELGHRVSHVASGEEALSFLDGGGVVDVVFSDVIMPGMSGVELAATLRHRFPALPVILTTGYSGEIAEAGTGGFPLLLKPYRPADLAALLAKIVR